MDEGAQVDGKSPRAVQDFTAHFADMLIFHCCGYRLILVGITAYL
jgi:hypothetical protein